MRSSSDLPRRYLEAFFILFALIASAVIALQALTIEFVNANKNDSQKIFLFFVNDNETDSSVSTTSIIPEGPGLYTTKISIVSGVVCLSFSSLMLAHLFSRNASQGYTRSRTTVLSDRRSRIWYAFLFLLAAVNSVSALIKTFLNYYLAQTYPNVIHYSELPVSSQPTTPGEKWLGAPKIEGEGYDLESWFCTLAGSKGTPSAHSIFEEGCKITETARWMMVPLAVFSVLAIFVGFFGLRRIGQAESRLNFKVVDPDGQDIELMGGTQLKYAPSHVARGHEDTPLTYSQERRSRDADLPHISPLRSKRSDGGMDHDERSIYSDEHSLHEEMAQDISDTKVLIREAV